MSGETTEIVRVHRDGDDVWVTVKNSWRSYLDHQQVADSVVAQYQALHPLPESVTAPSGSLAHLTWEQTRLYFDLYRNWVVARRSAQATRQSGRPEPVRTATRNVTAVWVRGNLMGIVLDPAWVEQVMAQQLSDDLTSVLTQRPEAEPSDSPMMRTAQKDLEMFWRTA